MASITILLPIYQSPGYLRNTLESIFAQSCQDFELLAVIDCASDKTLSILHGINDRRMRILPGRGRGLADALNLGLENAAGEYIARIDADDLMVTDRLKKQAAYLDTNPEVAVCGGWQQYFGWSTYLHAPPESPEQCKANLLFRCDLCHSTVMLRKSVFIQNHLYYNSDFAAEDFELWTRVLDYGQIANLPEVLGYYREDGYGLTHQKKQQLIRQNGDIVAASLERNLGLSLSGQQKKFFPGWVNPFFQKDIIPVTERTKAWGNLRTLLETIIKRNQEIGYYEENALRKAVRAEWLSLRCGLPFELRADEGNHAGLFQAYTPYKIMWLKWTAFCRNYQGLKRKVRKISSLIRK